MVTVVEMFNFAFGALCGGGFPNFGHEEKKKSKIFGYLMKGFASAELSHP